MLIDKICYICKGKDLWQILDRNKVAEERKKYNMKIETQDENYFILNLSAEGDIDRKAFSLVQQTEILLPFAYDEGAGENRICYCNEGYRPLVEYLNMIVLDFEQTKELFVNIVVGFQRLLAAGGKLENICENLYYVFIDPVSKQTRFVYLPMKTEVNVDGWAHLLKKILFALNTKDAEMVLGNMVVGLSSHLVTEEKLKSLYEILQNSHENIKIIEKKVEVDRVVEKVIERKVQEKKSYVGDFVLHTMLYTGLLIFIPYFFADFTNRDLLAKPGLLNYVLGLLAVLCSVCYTLQSDQKNTKDTSVVTMQPMGEKEEKE